MKHLLRTEAIELRQKGLSLNEISTQLGVAKSSVSIWVRNVVLTDDQKIVLREKGFYREAVELRRTNRLVNELAKRQIVIDKATSEIRKISDTQLHLMGAMLYWAEGGKTQRMVRFANGDPEMIKIMMHYFRKICNVPEPKFRGYIHIHPHLDNLAAERYWSDVTGIPPEQFFKTYNKKNKSSQGKKDTLPYGTLDIYVLDTQLFLKIVGWVKGIFASY